MTAKPRLIAQTANIAREQGSKVQSSLNLALRYPMEALRQLDRIDCSKSLSAFTRLAWHTIEPGEPYIHGWHIDAISEHLQAVATGELTRLVINVPPGTMKSTLVGVTFPAWIWGPGAKPHWRYIGAAHEQTLATRDNRRTRLLIESEWFQDRWPTALTSDQNEKTYFENEARGFRQSCAVAAMTGKRGHVVSWDDPINPEKANSPVARETAIRVFDETLQTRLVDPGSSAILITMQRLHQDDVSGHALAADLGYEHLMLPMEFEPSRRCVTKIGFKDPRTTEGELLFPERFPRAVVDNLKKALRAYGTAGQLQQRPAPREGGMFDRSKVEIIPAAPAGCRWVAGWDLAASTEKNSAYTVRCLMGLSPAGEYIIASVLRGQFTAAGVEAMVRTTASQDAALYGQVRGSLPQDPGAGGKAWALALVKCAAGYDYHASPESGDKETRAEPFAAQWEIGNVKLVKGPWNKDLLDEAEMFPNGTFKDQIDACSRGFMELTLRAPVQFYVGGGGQ